MTGKSFDDHPERTVFRPNPAGRRPGGAPSPAGWEHPVPPSAAPSEPARIAAPQTPVPRDDWGVPGADAAPPAFPRPALLERAQITLPHQNPIMRAAGPLLLLLGRLRIALMRASFAELMDNAAETITAFDAAMQRSGVPPAQATAAKYILCATADDIVQHIPSEDRHLWAQYSMLSRFFGERIGGVRFFQELEKALADPAHTADLLELQHACLALGFQGMHRTTPDGRARLQQLQGQAFEAMKRVRPRPPQDLSPRWAGLDLKARQGRARVPLWVVAALAAAGAAGLYLSLWTLLSGDAQAAARAMTQLHPPVDLALHRRVPAPPPPPPPPAPAPDTARQALTQLQRIRAALAPEIAAGDIRVDAMGPNIVIRVGNALLFESGKTQVQPRFAGLGARIAAVLDTEPGPIQVVGHTDSEPVSNSRFKSNFELSVARAEAVAAELKRKLADPRRVVAQGRGEDEPAAPNTSPANMARNRRVEIAIRRVD